MAIKKPNWTQKTVGSKQTADEMNSLADAVIVNADELELVKNDILNYRQTVDVQELGFYICDNKGNIAVKVDNDGLSAAKETISKIMSSKVSNKQYNI